MQASRKPRSWLAISIGSRAAGPQIQPSNKAILSPSRWLVGSSRSRASGFVIQTRASRASRCQPPLRSLMGRSPSSSGAPNSAKTVATRQDSRSRSAGGKARRRVSFSVKPSKLGGTSCSTKPSLAPRESTTLPSSGSIWPATQRSNVDLPAPLAATMPTRSPGPKLKVMFWKSGRGVTMPRPRKLMIAMKDCPLDPVASATGGCNKGSPEKAAWLRSALPCENLSQGENGASGVVLIVQRHTALPRLGVASGASGEVAANGWQAVSRPSARSMSWKTKSF